MNQPFIDQDHQRQANWEALFTNMLDTGGKSVGVRFGTDTASFAASNNTGAVSVDHGLGKTPQFIDVFPASGSVQIDANYVSGSRDSTSFEYILYTGDGSAVTEDVSVFWIVIG